MTTTTIAAIIPAPAASTQVSRDLRTSPLLPGRHLQSISALLPTMQARPAHMRVEQWRLALPHLPGEDAGTLVVDSIWQPHAAPAVVIIHGAAGISTDGYVLRAAHRFARHGFHVVMPNLRGSGKGIGLSSRLYHAALTADLRCILDVVEVRDDVTRVGLLGWSLGGHVALRYAAEVEGAPSLDGVTRPRGKLASVVTVSAPVDLVETDKSFSSPGQLRGLYARAILVNLRNYARHLKLRERERLTLSIDDCMRLSSIRDYDEKITAPSYGFPNAEAYYERASVAPHLPHIAVPVLAIHAEDDPIVPVAPMRAHAPRALAIDLVVTRRGGHVGFFEGLSQLWRGSYATERAVEHFERTLKESAAQR